MWQMTDHSMEKWVAICEITCDKATLPKKHMICYIITHYITLSYYKSNSWLEYLWWGSNVLFCLRQYSCTIAQLLACWSKYVVQLFVSGSRTEAQLSTANILIECLMLRDNLLSLSVAFLASGYCRLGFTSVCVVAFILFFYFTFTSLLCHSFLYCSVHSLSLVLCVRFSNK